MSNAGNNPPPAINPGDIVIADIPDPNGNPIDHRHPVMVFRANSEIAYVVAISTSFTPPPPRHWIALPHDPSGHSVTGLKAPCVLKCDWIIKLPVSSLLRKIGVVSTGKYALATDIITGLAEAKKAANQSGQSSS